jgi:hypothetical protein
VQLAIERTLLLAWEMKCNERIGSIIKQGLDIVLVGDNDFYSQRQRVSIHIQHFAVTHSRLSWRNWVFPDLLNR